MKKYKVAICGFGTIGSGVYEVSNAVKGSPFEIVKVFDLESPQKRAILGDKLVTDLDAIINDKNIDIVVETLGGLDFAYNVAKKVLSSGKHLVSANKEVVSRYLKELTALAKANNVFYFYEASVGGGIPIIHEIAKSADMDEVNKIYGIMNGTTNYILTEMFDKGSSFEDVIKEAQALGFAERDPSNDILGFDIARKINILSMLALKAEIEYDKTICYPLKGITAEFVDYMKKNNLLVKYVAVATLDNEFKEISVEPVVVKQGHPLTGATGALNHIVMENKYNGPLSLGGLGAGKLATACSLVKDMMEIVANHKYVEFETDKIVTVNQKISAKTYYVIKNNEILLLENPSLDELENCEFKARVL